MEKYITLAKDLKMKNAKLISSKDIHFDNRTMLKCRWGCEDFINEENIRCHARETTYQERVDMIRNYEHILLLHSHDPRQISVAALRIEKAAFLDGYCFASAICSCFLCKECNVKKGGICPTPEKIRPCDQLFGINVFETAKGIGLPIKVLNDENETPNRYGFVLID